jgi:hypothetical protein
VQIAHSSHRGSRDIEHIGSVHDAVELKLLKAKATSWPARECLKFWLRQHDAFVMAGDYMSGRFPR